MSGHELRIVVLASVLAACGAGESPTGGVCAPDETQYCTCVVDAGRILGEETCTADREWGDCVCTIEPDGGVTPPPPDAGFRHDAGPPDSGLPLLCSPYGTRPDEDCTIEGAALGAAHTCVRRAWGEVDCFGDDTHGQLGRGGVVAPMPGMRWAPHNVLAIDDLLAVAVEASGDYTCALTMEGVLWCFGSNASDQLGSGMDSVSLESSDVPLPVPGIDVVDRFSMSPTHACAVNHEFGAMYCWGSNSTQQLGRGASPMALPSSASPDKVVGYENARGVAAGDGFTCAFDASGAVKCFGKNTHGELGDGVPTRPESGVPVNVRLPTGRSAVALAAGRDHACAILDDTTVWCWGSNIEGQLSGDGTTMMSAVPVQIEVAEEGLPVTGATQISAGVAHTCVLNGERAVVCWGDHLALCDPLGEEKPVRARAMFWYGLSARGVSAGARHTCAVRPDRKLHCIGANELGQSFPGTPNGECLHDVPVDILDP